MHEDHGTITRLVNNIAAGGALSDADLHVRRLYDELRSAARLRLSHEHRTPFDTTELVHEAYLKLFRPGAGTWESRAHFFGSAARAMEQILIDAARRRRVRDQILPIPGEPGAAVLDPEAVSRAIEALHAVEPDLAEIARLRIFAGLPVLTIAEALGVSDRTVVRRWTFARTWISQHLNPPSPPAPTGDSP